MTYSIIARDPDTGQMGVAVQTFNFATGTWVPWAEGGVGAVATQALADRRYGFMGLDLMRGGLAAEAALRALLADDDGRDFRQVSMLDRHGGIATHTGARCFPHAGSYQGATFCTQANMMARGTVWGAMAAAFEAARGDLAERILAAMDAAQAEGGDLRGQQTAALLIVDREPVRVPLVDIRVDHHPRPLDELRRMLRLHRAYSAEGAVAEVVAAGDLNAAQTLLDRIGALAPDEPYLQYLRALHLAAWLDAEAEALDILRGLIAARPVWREYLAREAAVDNFGVAGLGARLLAALDRRD
ncbi:DUF1028 domain-containing protein [Aggregatilinea lenta]|uniref:DUF1028 domain-containing protein n=1 Tax=Aggregatilinea lenta TaxID=913108 RepID=UPI000E5AB3D9|nr:DUF1028 domain-containing protein [Aggregatilinea lenta]